MKRQGWSEGAVVVQSVSAEESLTRRSESVMGEGISRAGWAGRNSGVVDMGGRQAQDIKWAAAGRSGQEQGRQGHEDGPGDGSDKIGQKASRLGLLLSSILSTLHSQERQACLGMVVSSSPEISTLIILQGSCQFCMQSRLQ